MIDEALASENPLSIVPSTDGNGHGSVMASLAAGSSIEEGSFVGAAPDSQIVVVKLKDDSDKTAGHLSRRRNELWRPHRGRNAGQLHQFYQYAKKPCLCDSGRQ